MGKRLTLEEKIDIAIGHFMSLSAEEFLLLYKVKEFKTMLNLIPPTFHFLSMMVSLMYDFEGIEAYEYCAI